MKKCVFIFFLPFLLLLCIYSVEAQVAGKFKFAGVNVYGGTGYYTLGFGAEVPLGSSRWSFQGNLDITTENSGLFTLKPEFKYFLIGRPIQGFYLGAMTGIGFGDFNGFIVPIAPQIGYQHLFLKDKLSLEVDLEVGGVAASSNYTGAGFYLGCGATVGYVF